MKTKKQLEKENKRMRKALIVIRDGTASHQGYAWTDSFERDSMRNMAKITLAAIDGGEGEGR